eukprot:TRINITY_DN31467_c0_g1_i6.p1 TRINITY_DN31467_c0_g1~~TRINITY_DN31467_c0_g1_i6.p1  ORF type:complete len:476 (-),score=139.47 TRINITY_DN31467_c0_g1_i6:170-1597(-)
MRSLKIVILSSVFLISTVSAQMMGKNLMGSKGRGVKFPGNERKFGKARDGQVGEAVREVIIKAMCNYSTNANNTLNSTSTEFNVTNGNSSDLNSCEKCFLATPLSEIFSESGGQNASACTQDYLPRQFQPCAVGITFGNSSSEEISECYKDALKNSTIGFCSNTTKSKDPVERFQVISSCLRKNSRDFKKEVRMAMMDRVIGGKGCSFSALIALKLFGNKKRGGMKKDMDFDDALDDMLTDELEEDELEKPFKWTKDRPKRGGYGNTKEGKNIGPNKGSFSKGQQNRGGHRNQYNSGAYNAGNKIKANNGNARRGQSSGGRNQQNGGIQFQGGNNQPGGRFGGKVKQGGDEYDEYDYTNGQDEYDYGEGMDQTNGGRIQTNSKRGQGNGGRNQSNGPRGRPTKDQGQMNGGRNQARGGNPVNGGRRNNQGQDRFAGNRNQGGRQSNTNYDEHDYGKGENDYDYNSGKQDYDYNQG